MTEVAGRMRRKANNEKLTRVLSAKLSIDDYNRFVIYAKTAHAQGITDEPTPSRFLRFIASDLIEGGPGQDYSEDKLVRLVRWNKCR